MGIRERLGDEGGDRVTVVRMLLHPSSKGSRVICSVLHVVPAVVKNSIWFQCLESLLQGVRMLGFRP